MRRSPTFLSVFTLFIPSFMSGVGCMILLLQPATLSVFITILVGSSQPPGFNAKFKRALFRPKPVGIAAHSWPGLRSLARPPSPIMVLRLLT